MDAVEFVYEQARMCKAMKGCTICPYDKICACHANSTWSIKQIERAVKIVEKWAAEHPQETRLSKLLRQYPKAKTEVIKEYYQCPAHLGYSCPSPEVHCGDCWDTPVGEEEQE